MSALESVVAIGWPCLALLVARAAPWHAVVRPVIGPPGRSAPTRRLPPHARLGQAVLSVGARAFPSFAERLAVLQPRRVGTVVLLTLIGMPVAPSVTPALLLLGWGIARRRVRRAQRRRSASVTRAVPDLIDLVRLALDGGCTIPLAFAAIAGRYHGPLDGDLALVARDLAEGRGTASALEGLLARVGEPVRPLCAALLAGERYGLATAAMLDSLAIEARATRRRHDEQRARRLPITMLFPLITCTLPAFALLTVVPLLASGLEAVRW